MKTSNACKVKPNKCSGKAKQNKRYKLAPQTVGSHIQKKVSGSTSLYFPALNFFASCALHLKESNSDQSWEELPMIKTLPRNIRLLGSSPRFQNILATDDHTYQAKTKAATVYEFRMVLAAMFYHPRYNFVRVYIEDGIYYCNWGEDVCVLPESCWDAELSTPFYSRGTVTTDDDCLIESILNSGYADLMAEVGKSKHAFTSLYKRADISRVGSIELIKNLQVSDRVIVPASACASLDVNTDSNKFKMLKLETGHIYHTSEKETMAATDGKGDWTRRVITDVETSEYDWERSSAVWEVLNVCYKGGGSGHGRFDVYPDGLHLTLLCKQRKEILEFYVSGSFTCQVPPEFVLVEKK